MKYRTPYSDESAAGHLVGMLTERVAVGVVVDLGCGRAGLAGPLRDAGFTYVGLDRDADAVAHLVERGFEGHCVDLRAGDIAAVIRATVGERRLAAVLAIDVVEHVPDFANLLATLSQELARHDAVLGVSIPNVAHADLALKLLVGRWDTTAEGLLDETHLAFFDHRRVDAVMGAAGFEEIDRDDFVLERTEQGYLYAHPLLYPHTAVGAWLRGLRHAADEFGSVYQFVRLYRPAAASPVPSLEPPAAAVPSPSLTVVLLGDADAPSLGPESQVTVTRVPAVSSGAALAEVLGSITTSHVVFVEPGTDLPSGWAASLLAPLADHPALVSEHTVAAPWPGGMPTGGPLRPLLLGDVPLAAFAVPVGPARWSGSPIDGGAEAVWVWVLRTLTTVGVVDAAAAVPLATRAIVEREALVAHLGRDPLFLPAGWMHEVGTAAGRLAQATRMEEELGVARRRLARSPLHLAEQSARGLVRRVRRARRAR